MRQIENRHRNVRPIPQTDGLLVCVSLPDELLRWAREVISASSQSHDLPVDMGPSWRDGIALCQLVDSLCPGSCPDLNQLKPSQRLKNCRLGLRLASEFLQLPTVFIISVRRPIKRNSLFVAYDLRELLLAHYVVSHYALIISSLAPYQNDLI